MRAALIALAAGVGLGVPENDLQSSFSATTIEAQRTPTRRYRGDFEIPDTVAMVYDDDSRQMLSTIVAHVAASGATPFMIFEPEYATGDDAIIDEWYARFSDDVVRRSKHLVAPSNSMWIRDWGPIQTWSSSGRPLFLDAPYDEERPLDDELPLAVAGRLKLYLESVPWSLDGGALASNGAGLCVSSREFFEHWELEPSQEMLQALGCRRLVLVPALFGEDTMHVDLELQFLSKDRVIVQSMNPDDDPTNASRLDEVAGALIQAAVADGVALEVERIPMRPPRGGLAEAYVNGIRLADRFLMPRYGDADLDLAAHEAWARALPGVKIVDVDVRPLQGLGGALHCMALGFNRVAPGAKRSPR